MLTTISLFSGCGGSDLGARAAGANIVFANDISPHAIETYRKYQRLLADPGVDVKRGDIASIRNFPECDLVLGCYPCQSFTMGGKRDPDSHHKSQLFNEFKRCLELANPRYFIAENVGGMAWLKGGKFLKQHLEAFESAGPGYRVTYKVVNAKEFGVPADRKRVFLVGVRRDQQAKYAFPLPINGPPGGPLPTWASHGDAIRHLQLDAAGEYYDRKKEPFPWWYLSRNRKRPWDSPSYTITGNWRHVSLHPASPIMHMVESNLSDGSKQRWEFTKDYEHVDGHPDRPMLIRPRRLTWRECAVLQTFPPDFEPVGSPASKYRQIGNAVPPLLMESIVRGITNRSGLIPV